MLQIILVILPVFLLIFVGQVCRHRAFPGDGFWAPAEKLTYYLLLPALIVMTLAEAEFAGLTVWPMALAMAGAILLMTGLMMALRPRLGVDGPRAGLHQRLPVGGAPQRLHRPVGRLRALRRDGARGRLGGGGDLRAPGQRGLVLRQVAANPLILACLLGGLLNVTGLGLPPVLGDMLRILSRAALPIGLLAVGAGLDLAAARHAKSIAAFSSALKLIALPAMTYALASGFGADPVTLTVGVLFTALPVASSSFILARQLGGDAALMANLCAVQTLLALITLPLTLVLLR
jgi:predicted permease